MLNPWHRASWPQRTLTPSRSRRSGSRDLGLQCAPCSFFTAFNRAALGPARWVPVPVVSKAAKLHAALRQGFKQFDRRVVATAIGDMAAERLQFRCQCLRMQRPDESDFCDTFGDNR